MALVVLPSTKHRRCVSLDAPWSRFSGLKRCQEARRHRVRCPARTELTSSETSDGKQIARADSQHQAAQSAKIHKRQLDRTASRKSWCAIPKYSYHLVLFSISSFPTSIDPPTTRLVAATANRIRLLPLPDAKDSSPQEAAFCHPKAASFLREHPSHQLHHISTPWYRSSRLLYPLVSVSC